MRLWARGRASPSLSLGESGFEAGGEPLDDGPFLVGPLLRVAVQPHFIGVGRDRLVELHGLVRPRADGDGGPGVELAVAFAADDQVAVAVVAQPRDAGVGGDAAVHDHEGALGGLKRRQHAGQGPLFPDIAGEDLRAAHEAAGVEHQAQGQQRAVAAFLLGVSALRLRLPARPAFEIRVGQVVEGHRRLDVEQPHRAVEQVGLDGLAMLHQGVRGAVELHVADGLEVDAEQLAEAAAVLQPAVRFTFRCRMGEPPDDGAGGRRAQRAVDPRLGEQGRQAELLERPQADLLDADAAGTDQAHRVHVDRLHVGGSGGGGACPPGEQLGGDALGFLFDGGRAIGDQGRLAAQDFLDAGAQPRPLRLGDVEMSSEVEKVALADGVSDALGVHEAMGAIGLTGPGTSSLGAPDKHGARIAGRRVIFNTVLKIMALHFIYGNPDPLESMTYSHRSPKIPPKSAKFTLDLLNLG